MPSTDHEDATSGADSASKRDQTVKRRIADARGAFNAKRSAICASKPLSRIWPFRRTKGFLDQQTESPLFKLPFEIREQIWDLTLAPLEFGFKPHFHIYDKVLDSCTYTRTEAAHERRKKLTQMSLLLTCRAIYSEALHFLYDEEEFTLVLLAGRSRPRNRLPFCHSLGPIDKCEALFSRMRHVNLIIQPGHQPRLDKYLPRVATILQIANSYWVANNFCLAFNLHGKFLPPDTSGDQYAEFMRAFHSLGDMQQPIRVRGELYGFVLRGFESLEELLRALQPGSRFQYYGRGHHRYDTICLNRGAYGAQADFQPRLTTAQRIGESAQMALLVTFGLALLPMTAVVATVGVVQRKLDKGEW